MRRLVVLLAGIVGPAVVVGYGCTTSAPAQPPDDEAGADVTADIGDGTLDADLADTGPDGSLPEGDAADAGDATSGDTGADAPPDAVVDAPPDAVADAPGDALPEAAADASDAAACGTFGHACCAPGYCFDPAHWSVCGAGNVCVECGLANDPCCDNVYPSRCQAGGLACSHGTCLPCGELGQPCCDVGPTKCLPPGGVPPGGHQTFCDPTSTCASCGWVDDQCCPDNHGTSWAGGCLGAAHGGVVCAPEDAGAWCRFCGDAGQPACL
jgi:hypothetical protein